MDKWAKGRDGKTRLRKLKAILRRYAFRMRIYRLSMLRNRCYILAYHMVSEESPNGFYPQISVAEFEHHMKHLAANYRVIPLDELAHRLKEKRSVRKCAALTFDDGFRDNYTYVYPILRKLDIPATIFLATGSVDSGQAPWFIRLRQLFMETEEHALSLEWEGDKLFFSLNGPNQRKTVSDRIMKWIQHISDTRREGVLGMLEQKLGGNVQQPPANLMLTWDQVREMSRNGIHFGAHTVTHPVISRVTTPRLDEEIRASRDRIQEEIGLPVTTFAYPFGRRGHYSKEAIECLEKYKFLCAVTTESGANDYQTPIYELRRSLPWDFAEAQDIRKACVTIEESP